MHKRPQQCMNPHVDANSQKRTDEEAERKCMNATSPDIGHTGLI